MGESDVRTLNQLRERTMHAENVGDATFFEGVSAEDVIVMPPGPGDSSSSTADDTHATSVPPTSRHSCTPLGEVPGIVRASVRPRLPVVLTRDEVRALLAKMNGTPGLVARLLYGSGLRLLEALSLRVKDIDVARHQLIVRSGKGDKDASPRYR